MENSQQAIRQGLGGLKEQARSWATAATESAEEGFGEVRKGLGKALESGKGMAGRACEVVKRHPYEDIGVALGLGLMVGFLIARRFTGKS